MDVRPILVPIGGAFVLDQEIPADNLTLFVFSKWMNSRRSLDSGRIGILGHDQFEEHL
jgi:hypothetical protein